jgi:hypothetical protein
MEPLPPSLSLCHCLSASLVHRNAPKFGDELDEPGLELVEAAVDGRLLRWQWDRQQQWKHERKREQEGGGGG